MEYNFREIEKKWQKRWVENKTYQVTEDETKLVDSLFNSVYILLIKRCKVKGLFSDL